MKKKYLFKLNKKNGYTIIETMIAVSLFLIVVTVGMNALLNANVVHKKSQDVREEIDNLNFIIEDMARNLRTGSNFHCITGLDTLPTASVSSPKSCVNKGWGIAFEHAGGLPIDNNDQWVYYIDNNNVLWKSITGSSTLNNFYQVTTDGVKIDSGASGFYVLGAEPPPGDKQQPFVIIRLVGNIIYKGINTPFSLQTSMSQRLLDI